MRTIMILGCAMALSLVSVGCDNTTDVPDVGPGPTDSGVVDDRRATLVDCASSTVSVEVKMNNASPGFDPQEATISVGEVVRFENLDEAGAHTATSGTVSAGTATPDMVFNTGSVAFEATACVSFDAPGVYAYFDENRPTTATGTITVQ